MIREGLQKAIEQLDKSSPRNALRSLRAARTDARDLAPEFDQAGVDALLSPLDAYLTEVQSRALGPLDRKILRSGLSNRYEPPAKIVGPKD